MRVIKKHWFLLSVIAIIILSFALRFYSYPDRWGLAYDQAHDALVARGAIEQMKIPLVGPFSSAGAFQTSGVWYWLLVAGTVVAPMYVVSPWILISILSVVYVGVMIYLGTKLEGKVFGLLVGLLTALSTAQITQGVNLTVTAPMAIISALAVIMMLRYINNKTNLNLFLFAFFVALAPTMHTQGYTLIFLLVFALVFTGIPSFRKLPYLLLGLAVPFLPLIVFDLKNDFVNSTSMAKYLLHDQYKVSLDILGRRWLTYLGEFWPKGWSYTVGGNILLGYAFLAGVLGTALYKFRNKTLSKEWLIMLAYFVTAVFIIRYTRTPIFDSYLVLLHTFVLLLSAWVLYFVWQKIRVLGAMLILIVIGMTVMQTVPAIVNPTNQSYIFSKRAGDMLIGRISQQNIQLYDFKYLSVEHSFPVSLYLSAQGVSSNSGHKVGAMRASAEELKEYKELFRVNDMVFVDLNKVSETSLKKNWEAIDSRSVYQATEEWYGEK